jgi:2-C-methyl-D-erythritol 4-phosphate cytidylyltransferase
MPAALSAVVVSAGRSTRFQKSGAKQLKQLIEWDGEPLIIHTLRAMTSVDLSEIVVVVRPEDEAEIHGHLKLHPIDRGVRLVFGGARRQDSVRLGLEALATCDRVLIHDGARPFLSPEFLKGLVSVAEGYDCLIPVLPIVETLKEVDSQGCVVRTLDRNRFVRVQTPQIFRFDLIRRIHEQLKSSTEEFTDDAMMVESLGISVQTYPGDPQNIKVTVMDDLRLKNIHA